MPFIAACRPLTTPVRPRVRACMAGSRKHSALLPRGPCRGIVGPVWKGGGFGGFERLWARPEKKLSIGSKVKQEKGGGVAMHPTAGSQRPATPIVSRDSGLLGLQDKIGLLIPRFPENRVASPKIGCATAKIQGLLYKLRKNHLPPRGECAISVEGGTCHHGRSSERPK